MARWKGAFPAIPASVGILRGEMAAVARECGLAEDRVRDVMLAVSEAATNVVVHAYEGEGSVWAAAFVEEGTLRIVVSDDGTGMAPRLDSRGLGLGMPMIATVADALDIHTGEDGTEIHMTFPCPATATTDNRS